MTVFLPFLDQVPILQIIGVFGFLTYVISYLLLSWRVLTGECTAYFMLNTAAAVMVLISLTRDFNLASALIQVFWIAIGLTAVVIRLRQRGVNRTGRT